jgi:hypothetical protein
VRRLPTLFLCCWSVLLPGSAFAQRFGGDFGGAVGFWLLYVDPGIEENRSFGRDVGDVVAFGGRGFLQTGRVRLGGGGFGGSFSCEGLNESGNRVQGGLSGGGFVAEYLLVQRNLELAVGGLAGGGVVTIEELLPPEVGDSGDVERLRRRREGIFIGYPWVRLGYNPAPLVNAGLQLGYLVGSEDVGGFAVSIDVLVGIIP